MTRLSTARHEALAHHSVAVIRANQAPSGAYLASPTFPVYRYSWFRDGAFIADAMSRAGDIESAEAFFGWCARILVARRERVASLLERRDADLPIEPTEHLHARYAVDGTEASDEWANFQLDGYGTWLWALGAHAVRHGRSIAAFAEGAAISTRYIAAFWDVPSYDWWEEGRDHRHTSTLAALYAGLRSAAEWAELPDQVRSSATDAASALHDTVLADARRLGRLAKWLGSDALDGSLLACSNPFGLLDPADQLMTATVQAIELELVHRGGVHRYAADTYYGGGEWLLLAGFLGRHYQATERLDDARAQLDWIAAHATAEGDLPEQVVDHLLAPDARVTWLDRWGPIASPLLWSHAMYLALALELGVVDAPVHPQGP